MITISSAFLCRSSRKVGMTLCLTHFDICAHTLSFVERGCHASKRLSVQLMKLWLLHTNCLQIGKMNKNISWQRPITVGRCDISPIVNGQLREHVPLLRHKKLTLGRLQQLTLSITRYTGRHTMIHAGNEPLGNHHLFRGMVHRSKSCSIATGMLRTGAFVC